MFETIESQTYLIQVITDDHSLMNEVSQHFQQPDYVVRQVRDGRQAIEFCQQESPDVVLLDNMLAGINPARMCQYLQEISPAMPIIHITTSEDTTTLKQILGSGATDFVTRPINGLALQHRLRNLLNLYQSEYELSQQNQVLRTLNLASLTVSSSLSLEDTLCQVAKLTGEAVDATSAYVVVCDLDPGTLTVVAEYIGMNACALEKQSDLGVVYRLDQDFPGTREWLLEADDDLCYHIDDPGVTAEKRSHLEQYGGQSVFISPLLLSKESQYGYIELWDSRGKRDFTSQEVEFVQSIANQVALSIKNAALHQELEQYAKRLEKQNQALNSYSSSVAHDLKAPLTTILTRLDIIRMKYENILPEDIFEYLDTVHLSVDQMTGMIDQLLYLARLEDRHDTVNRVKVLPIIHNILNRYHDRIEGKQIQVHLQDEYPIVLGHRAWIEQIISNLISNAIKFIGSDNSEPTIRINARVHEHIVCFEVIDNGMGIAPEDQPLLFDMFTRFHSDSASGSGLGLSIAKQIVEKLGGSITVRSQPDYGSRFEFTLPFGEFGKQK